MPDITHFDTINNIADTGINYDILNLDLNKVYT